MEDKLLEAVRKHAEGHVAKHVANVEVYLDNPVGIGEHSDIISAIETELSSKKQTLSDLQAEHDKLQGYYDNAINNTAWATQKAALNNEKAIAFSRIAKEAKIRYLDIEKIGFSKVLSSSDFIKIDTIPLAIVKWNTTVKDSVVNLKELELRKWMQTELKLDTLFIKREYFILYINLIKNV